MKLFCSKIQASELTSFLATLENDYEKPNLKVHFPASEVNEDGEIEPITKESHKRAMIQQHSLHVASMVPSLFGHCLTSDHVKSCLNMLVKPAFAQKDDQAQFKLFSLVLTLQKLKIGDMKKGFSAEGTLWLQDVNVQVYKVLKALDETSDLAKHHRRILKYVKKDVSSLREKLFSDIETEKSAEKKLVLEVQAKRALAIEKLFLSLVLMTALPEDLSQISEQLEEIVDLQECFKNL
jgi:hypothetical protein